MVRKTLDARRWNINKIRIVSKSGLGKAFGMHRAKSPCDAIRARRRREGPGLGEAGVGGAEC